MKIDIGKLFRLIILIVWVILFGRLLSRDYFIDKFEIHESNAIQRNREESYMGIYFQGERIGYLKNHITVKDTVGIEMIQEAVMNLNILDNIYPVRINLNAELSHGSLLKNFHLRLSSPLYHLDSKGKVIGKTIHYKMNTGKDEVSNIIQLSETPFIPTQMRGYLLKKNMEEGKKFKIPYFDPITMSGKESIIEYRGFKKELFYQKGRIYMLHHFVEKISGMNFSFFLDEKGKVVKEVSPTGFVFISEPEFRAKNIINKGKELLSTISVPAIGTIDSLFALSSIRYRLTVPEETEFVINQDRQVYNENILVIHKERIDQENIEICSGFDNELSSTLYVQSDNAHIIYQANKIVNNIDNNFEKIRELLSWVYKNLDKKPVLGIPDAVSTLFSRTGDCNEHAALFAALSRSLSIPTRIVAGVTYHKGMFYYHAWNEVCLNGRWISLDATKNQFPADVSHIKFVQGETIEQMKIGSLIGNLKIEILGENI